jgi:transcriptional accessory protein Tex/SPT6
MTAFSKDRPLNPAHVIQIAAELAVRPGQVQATAELLEGGATVPFIARYRKEATGSLDEVACHSHQAHPTCELDARREAILGSLQERNLLTDELKAQISQAGTMTALEDIYLPYRPKRRTRATVAREKGLEPLARLVLAQDPATDPLAEANAFVDASKGVESVEARAAGPDIIAEWVNEDQAANRLSCSTPRTFHQGRGGQRGRRCKFEDYLTGGAGRQGALAPDSGHAPGRPRRVPALAGERPGGAGDANS